VAMLVQVEEVLAVIAVSGLAVDGALEEAREEHCDADALLRWVEGRWVELRLAELSGRPAAAAACGAGLASWWSTANGAFWCAGALVGLSGAP